MALSGHCTTAHCDIAKHQCMSTASLHRMQFSRLSKSPLGHRLRYWKTMPAVTTDLKVTAWWLAGTVPVDLATSSPTEATSLRLYIDCEFVKTTAQLCLESCTEADCGQRLRGCVKGCTAPVTATVLHTLRPLLHDYMAQGLKGKVPTEILPSVRGTLFV